MELVTTTWKHNPYVKKSMLVLAVFVVSFVLLYLFFRNTSAQFLTHKSNATTAVDTASLGVTPVSAETATDESSTSSQSVRMLEVHVANNGLTLLRGARVTAISGNTIHVAMLWGTADFTWEVQTDKTTKFLTATGIEGLFSDIQAGDVVTINGMLLKGGGTPIITAQMVRE